VPRTLDNTREFDPSYLTADPALPTAGPSTQPQPVSGTSAPDIAADIESDPFASYFSGVNDPNIPPKVLITTSPSATRATYRLCEELVGLIPGAELIKRKKGKDFVLGKISGWCAGRGYTGLIVVNENMKKPSTLVCICTDRTSNTVNRRHNICTPPQRPYGLLQIDFNTVLGTDFGTP
jgi:ribosome production factor 1